MRLQNDFSRWLRMALLTGLAVAMFAFAAPALAKTVTATLKTGAMVYEKASKKSTVMTTLAKGATVTVKAVSGGWARVVLSGKQGYVAKAALTTKTNSNKKSSGMTGQQVQNRLVSKGYLKASAATGSTNAATQKAIRIFQMVNGLSVNGNANDTTVKKIMSNAARKMPNVSKAVWSRSGIESAFRKRGVAMVIDLATGARLRIRRVGGHNHLDVEPKTANDTATLKRVYGGTFSWNSRAVLLIAGGRYYAAAMNSMPHGTEISKANNYDGQFCIHLHGSTTHGTEKLNPQHQTNVEKVAKYFAD